MAVWTLETAEQQSGIKISSPQSPSPEGSVWDLNTAETYVNYEASKPKQPLTISQPKQVATTSSFFEGFNKIKENVIKIKDVIFSFVPKPVKEELSKVRQGLTQGVESISIYDLFPFLPKPVYSPEPEGSKGDIKALQKQYEQSLIGKFDDKFQTSKNSFIKGLTGGIIKPKEKVNPDLADKIIAGVSEAVGTAITIQNIGTRLFSLAEGSTLVKNFIENYPRLARYTLPLLKNIGAFSIYGQLDPDLKDRFKKLAEDVVVSVPFTALGFVEKARYSIPASFGLGFGLAKLSGASNEDAFVSGVVLGILDGWGRMKGRVSDFVKGRQTDKILRVEALKVLNEYSDIKVKLGDPIEKINEAYRSASKKVHPDITGSTKEQIALNSAYEFLTGKSKKFDPSIFTKERYTPQEIINEIIKNGYDKTEEGKKLIKGALEAENKNQDIVVIQPKKPIITEKKPKIPPVITKEIQSRQIQKLIKDIPDLSKAKDYVSAKDFADALFSAQETNQIGKLSPDKIIARDSVDEKGVADYIKMIEEGKKVEPIEIQKEGDKFITVDGSHRLEAFRSLNKEVPVIYRGKDKIDGLYTFEEIFNTLKTSSPSISEVKSAITSEQPSPKTTGKEVKKFDISSKYGFDKVDEAFSQTPSDLDDRWNTANEKLDKFKAPLQEKINKLKNELEKIKSDRSKEAIDRKKEINKEIENLQQKISEAEQILEEKQTEFNMKLGKMALQKAKEMGLDLGEIGDGYTNVSEKWQEFRDEFLVRISERPYTDHYWDTPLNKILEDLVKQYGVEPKTQIKLETKSEVKPSEEKIKLVEETKPEISPEFQSLVEEAKNYKSAEEFVKEKLFEAYIRQFGVERELTEPERKGLYPSFLKDIKKYGLEEVGRQIRSYASYHKRNVPDILTRPSKLIEIYNFAHKEISKVKPSEKLKEQITEQVKTKIPPELEPFIKEAKKYKSVEEFIEQFKTRPEEIAKSIYQGLSERQKYIIEEAFSKAVEDRMTPEARKLKETVIKKWARRDAMIELLTEIYNEANRRTKQINLLSENEVFLNREKRILENIPLKSSPVGLFSFDFLYNIVDVPDYFTDGYLLLTDRYLNEVEKWKNEAIKKAKYINDYTKEDVEKLFNNLGNRNELVKIDGNNFYIGLVKIGKENEKPYVLLYDKNNKTKILLNSEAYKWLKKERYDFYYNPNIADKTEETYSKPILLKRNGREAGLIMPTRWGGRSLNEEVDKIEKDTKIELYGTKRDNFPGRETGQKELSSSISVGEKQSGNIERTSDEVSKPAGGEYNKRSSVSGKRPSTRLTPSQQQQINAKEEIKQKEQEFKQKLENAKKERINLIAKENDYNTLVRRLAEENKTFFVKRSLFTTDTRKAPSGFADVGGYSNIKSPEKIINDIKAVEFPEILRIAKNLLGKEVKLSSRFKTALGAFYPKTFDIKLSYEIFKKPELTAKVLAHELGHLADFLPDKTMARGNLVGRIATLKKHLKNLYGELDNRVIREELKKLTQLWKPFGENANPKYTKYRYSSSELYADAISVLFNDPALLKEKAPTFWEGFFEYLDRKPEVMENFNEIWNLLNEGEDAVFKKRDEEIDKMFSKAEEKFKAKYVDREMRNKNLVYQIKILFDDVNRPIIERINKLQKEGKVIPPELNPEYALKGLLYSDAEVKNFIEDNLQPAFNKAREVEDGWNKLGKILFYERVIYERGELANPLGYDPNTASFNLKKMEEQMSAEDWQKLQEAKKLFREGVKKVIDLAEKEGYYTPETLKEMKMNPAYATFQVIDYLDTYISPRVYHQVGTLKEISNPATATVMKLISTYKAIKRNKVKKLNINFLRENFSNEIEKAKTRWNGKSLDIMMPKDENLGLVITIENGKPQGWYVPKDVAETLNWASNSTLEMLGNVARAISQSNFYRPLFTIYNLGFQTFNFVRDLSRAWKNYPHKTLAEVPLSPIIDAYKLGKGYIKAIKPAFKKAFGLRDELIKEMENANILGLSYNDVFSGEIPTEQQQIERILEGYGLFAKKKKFKILSPIINVLETVGKVGDFIETLPKVAAYVNLKGEMPPEQLAEFIRTSIGSPAFRVKGRATPITNSIFLFSNAIKEGLKTDLYIATGKRGKASASSFWYKTFLVNILPKVIIMAIALGYFGDRLKKIINGISEYDKTNYNIIPIGLDENGKSVFIRIPQDETGRFIGGLFWKTMNINKDYGIVKSVMDVLSFGAGQLPNLSPSFIGLGVLISYFSGNNPYDFYRDRPIIPEKEFKAGFHRSFPILLDWLVKNQGLAIVLPSYSPKNPTALEKFLSLPVISNIIGRWIKVSDQGLREKLSKSEKLIEQKKAERYLEIRDRIDDYVKEYQKNPTIEKRKELERKLLKEFLEKGSSSQEKTNLIKRFRVAIIKGKDNPYLNSLIYSQTNDEKVEILKSANKELSNEEFKSILETARKNKIIGSEVIKKLRRQLK